MTTVPLQAIDTGIENIKVAFMAKATLHGPAIDALKHAAMTDDGNLAVAARAHQAGHSGHGTRGKFAHGFGNAFALGITHVRFARLPGGVILWIALCNFHMTQTFESAVTAFTQG